MPELPEVETMRRGILSAIGGVVTDVYEPKIRYRPIQIDPVSSQIKRSLRGKALVDVRRLGKRVVLDFEAGLSLVLQPKMAGLIALQDIPSQEHLRLVIELKNSSVPQILYWDRRGLGTINLWTQAELALQLNERRIGPDALEVEFEEFYDRFKGTRREVKPAMLDQHRVAGIGNLYASEILHLAKIIPTSRCDLLSKKQWRTIYDKMREVLQLAILYEGSTLSDGTYRNVLNKSGQFQNSHRVYDRAGCACQSCGKGTIVRVVQAQRSTFYCPVCQRGIRKRKIASQA